MEQDSEQGPITGQLKGHELLRKSSGTSKWNSETPHIDFLVPEIIIRRSCQTLSYLNGYLLREVETQQELKSVFRCKDVKKKTVVGFMVQTKTT